MVLTILVAKVSENYWQTLQDTYEIMTKNVPPTIKKSYLVQDQNNRLFWKILTIWESQDALKAMRESGETPTGVIIFQKVKAEPSLAIYDIKKEVS